MIEENNKPVDVKTRTEAAQEIRAEEEAALGSALLWVIAGVVGYEYLLGWMDLGERGDTLFDFRMTSTTPLRWGLLAVLVVSLVGSVVLFKLTEIVLSLAVVLSLIAGIVYLVVFA